MNTFRTQMVILVVVVVALPMIGAFALMATNSRSYREAQNQNLAHRLQREIDRTTASAGNLCQSPSLFDDKSPISLSKLADVTGMDALFVVQADKGDEADRVLISYDPHGWAGSHATALLDRFNAAESHFVVATGANAGKWLIVFGCKTKFEKRSVLVFGASTLERLVRNVDDNARLSSTLIKIPNESYPRFTDSVGGQVAIVFGTNAPTFAWKLSLATLTATAGLISLLGILFLNRRLRSAIDEIQQAVTRVGDGDLDATLDEKRVDEFGKTATAFNTMVTRLQGARSVVRDEERVAAWKDIARTLAHEIKNPLSPIQVSVENIKKAYDRGLQDFDEILQESTTAVLEEVGRLRRIVDDFGEFAQLPSPKKNALNLRDVGEHVRNLLSGEDAQIRLIAPPHALNVLGDRDQLTQVFINLVKNAIEATKENTSQRAEIDIELRQTAQCTEIVISDNGPGLSTMAKEEAFTPNFTTKRKGSGLGLAIVERIVDAHSGQVRFTTQQDGGAAILISLPTWSEVPA